MVTSVTGPVMAMRDEAGYAAAKAALVGLARSAAVDYGRHGITVNAVAPGWIATGSQTDDEASQGERTPLGRQRYGGRGGRRHRVPVLTGRRLRHRAVPRGRRRQLGRGGTGLT